MGALISIRNEITHWLSSHTQNHPYFLCLLSSLDTEQSSMSHSPKRFQWLDIELYTFTGSRLLSFPISVAKYRVCPMATINNVISINGYPFINWKSALERNWLLVEWRRRDLFSFEIEFNCIVYFHLSLVLCPSRSFIGIVFYCMYIHIRIYINGL